MANVAAFRITFGFSDQADYWKTYLFYLYRPMKTVGANQQEGWTANLRLSAYCNWMPPALMEVARFPVYFES